MNIPDEFAPDVRRWAAAEYLELLCQFQRLMTQHGGDGTHPDCVKAKELLDRARRCRCELDPVFAAQQPVAA